MKSFNTLLPAIAGLIVLSFLQSGIADAADGNAEFIDSILGVGVGMSVQAAREILAPLGESGGRDTRSGGRKEAYILKETPYAWIAFKAGHSGSLKWVSANMRQGEEIPFAELGDLELADSANEFQVIWNVQKGESGYRLVAKGQNGKAKIVYLLSLD